MITPVGNLSPVGCLNLFLFIFELCKFRLYVKCFSLCVYSLNQLPVTASLNVSLERAARGGIVSLRLF